MFFSLVFALSFASHGSLECFWDYVAATDEQLLQISGAWVNVSECSGSLKFDLLFAEACAEEKKFSTQMLLRNSLKTGSKIFVS